MLMLKGVSKIFGSLDNGTQQVKALEDVSLEVGAGEFFSIIGPSGCGKSTLVRIIGGLIPDFEGEVRVGPERVEGPHPWIAVVFQEILLFDRTVAENLRVGNPDATEQEMRAACERAQVLDVIEKELGSAKAGFDKLQATDIPAFNKAMAGKVPVIQ